MSQPHSRPGGDLQQQLDAAHATGASVQAWVRLKPKLASQAAASPDDTKTSTQKIVKRVEQRTGQPPHSVKVLPNLGAFIVSGPSSFVRELIDQPEIESARSTGAPLELIRPVETSPAKLPAAPRRHTRKRRGKRKRR